MTKTDTLLRQFMREFSDVDEIEGVHSKNDTLTIWVTTEEAAKHIQSRISDREDLANVFTSDILNFKYD